MSARLCWIVVALAAGLAGCAKASASNIDSENPLACAFQFQVNSVLLKKQGDVALATSFHSRAKWYAQRARAMPEDQRSDAVLDKKTDTQASDPAKALALTKECVARQDADPAFRG